MGILKKRRKSIFLLWVLTPVFLSGCLEKPETDVPPERIYTTYYLAYNEAEPFTIAGAIFSADNDEGWRQELKGSARVDFESEELTLNENVDEYLVIFDNLIPLGDFHYTDQNGDTYVNTAELKIIGYPGGLDTLDIREDFIFEWNGDPLEEGEFVSISFGEESLGVRAIFQQDEIGATSITVPREELIKLGLGTMNITLYWEKIIPTSQDPGVGGEIHSTYVVQPQEIVID